MTVKQISVFLENKMGQLQDLTELLADAKVNLIALNIAETKDYGIVRIIADDVALATDSLIGAGYVISVNDVQEIAVKNEVGSLNRALKRIADAGVSIEYMYSIFGDNDNLSKMVFKVDKPECFPKF